MIRPYDRRATKGRRRRAARRARRLVEGVLRAFGLAAAMARVVVARRDVDAAVEQCMATLRASFDSAGEIRLTGLLTSSADGAEYRQE